MASRRYDGRTASTAPAAGDPIMGPKGSVSSAGSHPCPRTHVARTTVISDDTQYSSIALPPSRVMTDRHPPPAKEAVLALSGVMLTGGAHPLDLSLPSSSASGGGAQEDVRIPPSDRIQKMLRKG